LDYADIANSTHLQISNQHLGTSKTYLFKWSLVKCRHVDCEWVRVKIMVKVQEKLLA